MKGGTAIRKTRGSSIGGVSEEKKKNSSSDEARGRTLTLSSTTPLMILFPKDPARPLMKSSQRPQFLSSLLYQIHCIRPVGFGFAHIYSERPPKKRDPTEIIKTKFEN